jgi:hypothetical protein
MREVKSKIAMILQDEDNCAAYKRHNSEKAICLYTLTYINIKKLMFKREEIVLQSDCNRLVCFRKYTRKVYT